MKLNKEFFKETIKNILVENKLVILKETSGYYNNNISRESYWANNFPEYKEQFFQLYNEWKENFEGREPQVSFFIKCFFFDKNHRDYGLYRKFKDIKDYFENANHSELICKYYHSKFKDKFNEVVNFSSGNIYEVKYCFDHNLTERPKCKECGKDTVFTGKNSGYYRDFCCLKCQMDFNNKEKEPKLSSLSDDEIRKVIESIPPDRRNLTNQKFADVFLNIYNFSKDAVDLKQTERQFLFMNKLSTDYIICPYCKCHKKIFQSSIAGYKATCGRKNCVKLHLYPNCQSDLAFSNDEHYTIQRNVVLENSFLYVIFSKNNDFYKIGISTNPTSRIGSFLKFFDDFEIKYCVFLKNANEVEYHLHNHFKEKQVIFESAFDGYTEYFKLDESDLEYIKKVIYENQ